MRDCFTLIETLEKKKRCCICNFGRRIVKTFSLGKTIFFKDLNMSRERSIKESV